MGILLYIIATLLYIPLTIINFIVVLITHIKKNGFIDVICQYFFEEAISIDIFANRSFRTLWNNTLIKIDGHKFGKENDVHTYFSGGDFDNPEITLSNPIAQGFLLNKLIMNGQIVGQQFSFIEL